MGLIANSPRATASDASAGPPIDMQQALYRIAQRAAELDHAPRFPADNLDDLRRAGALAAGSYVSEVDLVRAVARVDGSTARILDGHLNGLERLRLAGPSAAGELQRARAQASLLGVWGADPVPGEGAAATIVELDGETSLRGVKTYCSGVGGVDRALVVAFDAEGARRLVYIDAATEGVRVDRSWYRASGLRCSESHRVEFDDAPVLLTLGGPGELSREPHFSRDAIRTTATWVGLVDAIVDQTVRRLGETAPSDAQLQLLGNLRVAAATADLWLSHAVQTLGAVSDHDQFAAARNTAVECRVAISDCARTVIRLSAEVCGSRALVDGGDLDRARRDLDLFLLQHRLGPKITALGSDMVGEHRS